MERREIFAQLPDALLPWYAENKRELPWRADCVPYHIWISEIMLQQTRVEAVKGYYSRFLEALPTVEALANADDEMLRKLWEGLGYYSRVRNLKKAACMICEEMGGIFPDTVEALLRLPGIGDYTAGAIGSIAFQLKVPAVDGNVLRVAARLTDDSTPVDLPPFRSAVTKALAEIYPENAGEFTQALMELGATVCGPNRKPDCNACPCCSFCLARKNGTAEQLPVKTPKKPRRSEDLTVFIFGCNGLYALEKRGTKGLLADLWQFPNVPGHMEMQDAVDYAEKQGLRVRQIKRQLEKEHIFTHITWRMRGFYMETEKPAGSYTWLTRQQLTESAALPTAFRKFWEETEYV